jgi:molybdate transport system substrate-binding protein
MPHAEAYHSMLLRAKIDPGLRGLSVKTARAIGALAMLVGIGAVRFADAVEIHVYCTGAPSVAAKIVAANFAASTGHHLTFTVGQPATVERDLIAGDKADVVIVPAPIAAKLMASGVLRAGSAVDLARVGIGVVVRVGAQAPDIADDAAIRKLLTDARAIVYPDPTSGGGSAGRAIAQMIDRMGLTEIVRPKLTRTAAIGGGVALVADGKAEVGFFNISEILPIPGVTLVGPLPADLQNYIVFAAAIPAHTTAPEPAVAFIQALAAPAAGEAWRKSGMEPVAAAKAQ